MPGGSLDPFAIPRFVTALFIPSAMPPTSAAGAVDYYEIGARQIRQQVLPSWMPATPMWAYGSVNHAGTFRASPGLTFEARVGRITRVKWINELVDRHGRFRRHLLPIDQTLRWANPPGPRDGVGTSPRPYTGPVPLVPHLHGGHTFDDSDGYPEAWFLPAANNLPRGFATEGTWYRFFRKKAAARLPSPWETGSATFDYANDQAAATLWVHDHTLGIARVNLHAGLSAFYLLRGDDDHSLRRALPGPAPSVGDDPRTDCFEIPIMIQDRSFNADGSLFFPADRALFEGVLPEDLRIPFVPPRARDGRASDVPPIWSRKFFGNTMVVNGNTWPFLDVEQRRYRFRFLNACNARTLMLELDRGGMAFWQIGGDGGFLPRPVRLTRLLLAPAERADVIVDFTRVPVGTTITLINVGPDSPFGGGVPGIDFPVADPQTTGGVMQFRVRPSRSVDRSLSPDMLPFAARAAAAPSATGGLRRVSLNELDSGSVSVVANSDGSFAIPIREARCGDPAAVPFGPAVGLLGTVRDDGRGNPLAWTDPLTEDPALGAEVWEIRNFTADAHPIHIHQTQFRVLDRAPFDPDRPDVPPGPKRPPEPWETGAKDTVIAYPGEITRLAATFDLAGQYVWRCHSLDDMLRPIAIGKPQHPRA